jgi:heat shock protein HslJ/uncharacterized lipoprotein YbaY
MNFTLGQERVRAMWQRAFGLLIAFLALATAPQRSAIAQPGTELGHIVSGTVVVLARIALPPSARLVVELRQEEGGRVVASYGRTLEGRQSPFAFSLTARPGRIDPARSATLRAVIRAGGMRFESEPVAVNFANGRADLGEIVARPARRPLAFATELDCEGLKVGFGMAGDVPTLRIGSRSIALREERSASGARYVAVDDPRTEFRSKGREGVLILDGGAPRNCLPVERRRGDGAGGSSASPDPVKLDARGHEPSWSLAVQGEGAKLSLMGEAPVEATIISRRQEGGALRITARTGNGDMAIAVRERICSDTMTGMPFPLSVMLEWQGRRLKGCGGETRSVLTGGWIVREINGKPITARTPEGRVIVTMAFDSDGRINGKGGCNRYMGGYELTPERLTFKPAAASMMACPQPMMEVEQAFFAALPTVTAVRSDGAGRLVLSKADGKPALLLVRGP